MTMTIDEIAKAEDRKFYIEVLKGNGCQCGRPKYRGKALCFHCYKLLPRDLQADLYKSIGNGFEEAYEQAISYLN